MDIITILFWAITIIWFAVSIVKDKRKTLDSVENKKAFVINQNIVEQDVGIVKNAVEKCPAKIIEFSYKQIDCYIF